MKRSGANPTDKPHKPAVFVLDETLSGRSIVRALNDRGIPIRDFTEFFTRGATDPALVAVMRERPEVCLITRDRDFRYKADVTEKLLETQAGAFVLTSSGNKTGAELVEIIASAWKGIERFAKTKPRPFVATIKADGTIGKHQVPK